MADTRFKDFDAFLEEEAESPLSVRLFGEDWELPGELPATAVLRQQRMASAVYKMAKNGGLDLSDPDVDLPEGIVDFDADQHAAELVGRENLEAWKERGISQKKLSAVLQWVNKQHMGGEDEEEEGDEEDPTTAPQV